MPEPGSRQDGACKGCKAKIVFILSSAGRWVPCERLPCKADGVRVLVFADGVTGKRHGDYTLGHEAHFKNCPNAAEFRKSKKDAEAKVDATGEEEPKAALIGCGCLGGER